MQRHTEPLAYRLRPRTIDEVYGQEDIIGEDTALFQMIQNGHLPSLLLYGPPGTGKTSLAFAIANTMQKDFYALNATTDGKKDVEAVISEASMTKNAVVFLDEIHRFNKSQQDILLKALENGTFTLIGATTENPFHSVNPAIRSRCGQIKELKLLDKQAILKVLQRALHDTENGFGSYQIKFQGKGLALIADVTGDARTALNIMEDVIYASKIIDNEIAIDDETIKECIKNKGMMHDKKGDIYYNLLSSFQKSIRGSDVQAGLYYLARLLEGGDLISICRRLLVIAYEDIGLANTELCARVTQAVETVEKIGMPEARIPLAVTVVELCLSPKSNTAYKALDKALNFVKKGKTYDVPNHLKDTHYEGAKELGHGASYKYPHDYPNHWVNQQYLPDEIVRKVFYEPSNSGDEQRLNKINERLNQLRKNTSK